jgi:CheY-like chemotaxis protein
MQSVRVLIVDDSAVTRRLLGEVLASDPEIEVAGTAGNGSLAFARIPEVKPDLITLDVEMPGMNGLETITEIRELYPKLPVIMFSNFTERGARATLDALARGATDYVTKPMSAGGIEGAREGAGTTDSEDQVAVCRPSGIPSDPPGSGCGRAHTRAGEDRYCGHRHIDWRPQRAGGTGSAISSGLPRAYRDCPTHAALVYAPAG